MADVETTTTCNEGYKSVSRVGDFRLTIDATGEEGPPTNDVLVADYASCFLPAVRVGGQQNGVEDLGKLTIEAEGDHDEDDDLEAIRFDMKVEADVDDDTLDDIVADAEDICHIHSVVREDLHADITAEADAF